MIHCSHSFLDFKRPFGNNVRGRHLLLVSFLNTSDYFSTFQLVCTIEGDRCQQVLLQIFVDGKLNFNFLSTPSGHRFPLFDNSILKMLKTS